MEEAYIHCILDGRDVPPASAIYYIEELEEKIKEIGIGKIATIMGRYYAMDRDSMWNRVKLAYDAIVNVEGEFERSPKEAILSSYNRKEYDEFIKPKVILENGKPVGLVNEKF